MGRVNQDSAKIQEQLVRGLRVTTPPELELHVVFHIMFENVIH